MTTTNVDTERIMPRSIRKERILCARSVSSATFIGSRSGTLRLMDASSHRVLREGDSKGFRELGPRQLSGNTCLALLQFQYQFRDRLIGRTSAFGAEYPGSSPGPGTNPFRRPCQPTFRLAAFSAAIEEK